MGSSEQRYAALMAHARDAIVMADGESRRILDVNRRACEMLGRSREELIGMPAMEMHPPALREEYSALFDRHILEGGAGRFEVFMRHRDGRDIPVSATAAVVEIDGNRVIQGIFRDISEQKRFEAEIRRSEFRYHALFEHMQEACGYHRMIFRNGEPVDYEFIDVNPKFEEMTGLHDVIGKRVSEVIPGIRESNPELFEIYGRVAAGNGPARFETQVEALGSWYSVSVYSPEPEHFVAIFDNVTERKQAEVRMREESELRRVLIESAAEGICMWQMVDGGPQVEFAVWNRRMEQITGYTMQEINARGWCESMYREPEAKARAFEHMQMVADGGSLHGLETEVVDRSGKDRVLRISSVPITLFGDQDWVLAIMEDVTEHRELESNYRQIQKIEALGTLVGGIAHDFNNILAGMLGNIYLSQTLAEGNPELAQHLEVAESLGFRAADLITQLLTFARKGQVHMEPLELAGLVREFFDKGLLQVPANIELELEICGDQQPVLGDATQIQQILMNLLSNACDALGLGIRPKIRVRLDRFTADAGFRSAHPDIHAGRFARLSVSDNGTGIRPEYIERVFEPFFTTKEIGKGTGLGLATVYSIVQGHEGVLDVDSRHGDGTTVHVYLPLRDAEKVPKETEGAAESMPEGHGELILIADDEPELRDTLAYILQRLGYRTLLAEDGEKALALFDAEQADIALVILDVVMPKLGGPDVARRMRDAVADLPVIFSTGYDAANAMPGNDTLEHEHVLTKPFRVEALAAEVRQLLAGR